MPPPDRPERSAAGEAKRGASLGDALAWLDHHVNLEAIAANTGGRTTAPDLGRAQALLSAMGNPHHSYPILHVTGTNGKGSTSRLATLLLEAQGLTVGSYTSPHLERLNERIAIGGEPIPDLALADLLGSIETLEGFLLSTPPPDGLAEPPTWFEIMTVAAYRYYGDEAVAAAVVEVGLGGRYDATNVADATVALVTNVELDHVEILGNSRASIAAEKAGIIKHGSIAVIGERDPEIVEIFAERSRSVGASALWRRDVDFSCSTNELAHGGRLLDLHTPGASYEGVFLPLHGAHQGENASAALAAVEAFFGSPLEEDVVAEAFGAASVPGRLEVMGRRPLVIIDGAHNLAGATALGNALADDFAAAQRVLVVMGCLRGRDPAELLDAIGLERLALVVGCAPSSPRALPAEAVASAAKQLGYDAKTTETVDQAIAVALAEAREEDLVVVTGSLYVVAEARSLLSRRGV